MSLISRCLVGGVLALSALVVTPAFACHTTLGVTASSNEAGATATYTVTVSPNFVCNESFANPHSVTLTFPSGFDVGAAGFDPAASAVSQSNGPWTTFPAASSAVTVNAPARQVTINGIQYGATWATRYQLAVTGIRNPASTVQNQYIGYYFRDATHTSNNLSSGPISVQISPGINIGAAQPAPAVYAEEINASADAPVLLTNASGSLNLRTPLRYSFSTGEVRYARIECDAGMSFDNGSGVSYGGGGSASVGTINGQGGSAIHFSITARDGNVTAGGMLSVSGGRRIVGTESVSCTYGLYDYPSQAAAGGAVGRVASVTGDYIKFASSTVFASEGRTSVADVEADPAFSAFVPNAPTTPDTAALSHVHYELVAPAPRKANGSSITLADLHATGASGTAIVVEGDFSAAANDDGSYTGAALGRVYLSSGGSFCNPVGGISATSASANRASFAVGATAADRMLCLAPLDGTAIPVADYTATLAAVAADPAAYSVSDIGPQGAGEIERNGTQLQIPLAQVTTGWLSRMTVTNTGNVARTYTIAVQGETGNTIGTGDVTGTVPARGSVVVDLTKVLRSFSGKPRATLNVNVAGPNAQIQGLYQIVNPTAGTISNHVMVRPF